MTVEREPGSRMQQRSLWLVAAVTLLLLLVFSPLVPETGAVTTCDTSWASAKSGFWDVSANWTNGVPTSSSNACITVVGAYRVTLRGSTNVAAGLTLGAFGGLAETLEVSGSTEAGDAKLTLLSQGTSSGGIHGSGGVGGRLVLTTTDPNAAATVDIAGGTLNNLGGRIIVAPGAGGSGGRFWHGPLQQNQGIMAIDEDLTVLSAEPWRTSGSFWLASGTTFRIDSGLVIKGAFLSGDGTVQGDATITSGFVFPGVGYPPPNAIGTLTIAGNYTHGGKLSIGISGPSAGQFDVLRITGAATVRGELLLSNPFKATLGQTFPILTAASRAGSFKAVRGAVIDSSSALYYAPTYPPSGVTLEVRRATMNIAPSEGPPGTSVTLTGSGWTPGDSVKLTLIDSARQKFKTFSRATVDGSGTFSAAITIPSGAATGAATVTAESSTIPGLSIKKTFLVTS